MKKAALILTVILLITSITFSPANACSHAAYTLSSFDNSSSSNDILNSFSKFLNALKEYFSYTREGIAATLIAKSKSNKVPSKSELQSTKDILNDRLLNSGFDEIKITIDDKTGKINIEAYSKRFNKTDDPRALLNEVIRTGSLTFQEVSEDKKDKNGIYLPTGKIIVEGKHILDAAPEASPQTGGIVVALSFNTEGTKKFASATKKLIGKPIGIFYDSQLLVAPTVQAEITDGNVIIAGLKDAESAGELAANIKSGALPVSLSIEGFKEINPNKE